MTSTHDPIRRSLNPTLLLGVGGPLIALLWAYWTTLGEMSQRWSHDPQYSHGYLVPAFALALLWLRRDRMPETPLRPSWGGAVLLATGITMRLAGTYFYYVWSDAASLLLCRPGLCRARGGGAAWRWAWPSLAFLVFMTPFPPRLAVAMPAPPQRTAPPASPSPLQTLGMPAV